MSVVGPDTYFPIALIQSAYLNAPSGLAFDSTTNKLYVANYGDNTIPIFNENNHTFVTYLSGGALNGPFGSTVGSNEKLYLADYGKNNNGDHVSVFDVANGNKALSPITGLDIPGGVAYLKGLLYVSNYGNNTVSVFDTTNNNALVATISGNGLNGPFGVATDGSGRLYVSNYSGNTISEFSTSSPYDALGIIKNNGLNAPMGLAFGETHLFVANSRGDTISVFTRYGGSLGQMQGSEFQEPYALAYGCY